MFAGRSMTTAAKTDPCTDVPSSLAFSNYDAVGFDIDHTIAQYNVPELFDRIHHSLTSYLVEQCGYDEAIKEPLDADFIMRGIVLDIKKGNFIKLAEDGTVLRASHGTRFLDDLQIQQAYGEKRHWPLFEKMIETANNIGNEVRIFENFFDMPLMMAAARLIDIEDSKSVGKQSDYTVIYQHLHDAIEYTYDPKNFAADKGGFFPLIKQDQGEFLQRVSDSVKAWLKRFKAQGKVVFMATSSFNDFAMMSLSHVIGDDWRDYFDFMFTFARKPGFFKTKRSFKRVEKCAEKENVTDVVPGQVYSQGSCDTFMKYLRAHTGREDPRVLFFGDSLRSDVFPAKVYSQWDTVLVLEEMLAERHSFAAEAISEPDGKRLKLDEPSPQTKRYLTSHSWGSFFTDDGIVNRCDDVSSTKLLMNTLWGFMVRKYADIAIPQLEYVADLALEHKFKVFNHQVPQDWGFFPGVPSALQVQV